MGQHYKNQADGQSKLTKVGGSDKNLLIPTLQTSEIQANKDLDNA